MIEPSSNRPPDEGDPFGKFMMSDEFIHLADGLPKRPRPHHNPVHGAARLASDEDLGRYLERPDEEHPFAFNEATLLTANDRGEYDPLYRRTLYLPASVRQQNLLVVSKIGGGKTSRYLLPSAFADVTDPAASLVWVDTKGDVEPVLSRWMRAVRLGQKPVVVNFADARRTTRALNLVGDDAPLDELFDDVLAFCTAADSDRPGRSTDSPFWIQTATRWLVAVLVSLRAEHGRASLADAHHVLEGDQKRLLDLLDRHRDTARFAGGMASFIRSGSQNADTTMATLCGYLRHFVNDHVAAVTSRDEFRFEALFRKPTVLILEINQADLDRFRPLLNLFVTRLFRAVTKFAERQPGGRLPRPLNVYLDDLPALGRVPQLESYLNTLRSRDVRVTAAVQSLSQLSHWYGTYGAEEVLAGFGTKIFQPHLEQVDADWVSRHAGLMTVFDVEYAEDRRYQTVEQRGRSVQRPLLTADEVRLSPEHWFYNSRAATVFLPDAPPFQAWFRPGYELPCYAQPIRDAARRPRAKRLRRRAPLSYTVPAIEPTIPQTAGLPPGITNTRGWTDEQVLTKLDEVKKALDWDATAGGARTWWEAFENENRHRVQLVLRLAEELKNRSATITEFFLAYVYSNTENIQANLCYLDYMRLKKQEEQNKKAAEAKQ